MTLNLAKEADVLRFCELRRGEVARQFAAHGRYEVNGFSFSGFVFATHEPGRPPDDVPITERALHWKPGPKLPEVQALRVTLPTWVTRSIPPENHSRLFSTALREYARITAAIGTLLLGESWHVIVDKDAEIPKSIADVPGRGESLRCFLEHQATGLRGWAAEITRYPTRLGEWERHDLPEAEGNFCNLTNAAQS